MWASDSLEMSLMLGKIEGRRRRGHQRMRCLDGITDAINLGKFWEIARPGMLQSMGSQRVRHNWVTEQHNSNPIWWASLVAQTVKSLPANVWDIRDTGSVPGLGRSPGVENGNPLPYSCLESPMDRGVWWAAVHRVTKSRTWLKRLSMHTHIEHYDIQVACKTLLYTWSLICLIPLQVPT